MDGRIKVLPTPPESIASLRPELATGRTFATTHFLRMLQKSTQNLFLSLLPDLNRSISPASPRSQDRCLPAAISAMAPETPKGVSSRLLTMKFMQRAAASASSAASPDSAGPSKKRKHQHSPAQGRFDAQIDRALIQAALDDQEATRQAALEKHAAADIHWTLDDAWDKATTADATSTPLNVVYVGYGNIDSDDETGVNEDAPAKGRTSTKVEEKPRSKACLHEANKLHL